ncbi:MAG: hypothetical protein NZ769_07360, partial [Anaerolineae bacterium]|nr:hypothetical protein [Anaerolineae bacterium]
GPRLEIRGSLHPDRPGDTPAPYHAYDLVLPRGVKLSVVWDEPNARFITCDNLKYVGGPTQLDCPVQEFLKAHQSFCLEEPIGYGAARKVWGKVVLNQDAQLISNSEYVPAIPILAEPRTFMALVPASEALKVVEAIRTKYEREMGKVRNRLPLHLGIVFADRRTPLRVILDAGRRMLTQRIAPDGWEVLEVQLQPAGGGSLPSRFSPDSKGQFACWYEVRLRRDSRYLTWYIPLMMGDGKTEDRWYPYVFLAQAQNAVPKGCLYFQSVNPWNSQHPWLIHAKELQQNYAVYFTPATLDWVWLDMAGRRLEVAYDDQGRRRDLPRRPYLLDELEVLQTIWQTLKDHLSATQIYALVEAVESRRESWNATESDTTFREFCRATLASAEWRKNQHGQMPWEAQGQDRALWLEAWTDYAARGWLADAAELHLQILKEDAR